MRYRLFGSIGSPYALKLRALMRYKRLPFDWLPATLDWIPQGLPHEPLSAAANFEISNIHPRVVPAVYFPHDKIVRNESTTIAYLLDNEHPQRPIVPDDASLAFLSHLLEDMADEWLVKIAFWYRWGNDDDAAYKSRIVTGEFLGGNYPESILVNAARHFAQRQQSRMALVGAVSANAPVIEASFERLLAIMQMMPTESTFIFGATPTLADFGFYGQLQSLATDPSPWALMRKRAPGVFPYLQVLEDSSGIELTSLNGRLLNDSLLELLKFAAEFYLPYLAANEKALLCNQPIASFAAAGATFQQTPFKYHGKCFRLLRDEYDAIPPAQQSTLARTMREVGLLDYFQPTETSNA